MRKKKIYKKNVETFKKMLSIESFSFQHIKCLITFGGRNQTFFLHEIIIEIKRKIKTIPQLPFNITFHSDTHEIFLFVLFFFFAKCNLRCICAFSDKTKLKLNKS